MVPSPRFQPDASTEDAEIRTALRGEVTRLLGEVKDGNQEAIVELISVAYDELRALARSLMSRERADHTLQSTALVHEAAIRLFGDEFVLVAEAQDRAYFFGAMTRAMRRVLVDHARARNAARRGGGVKAREEPLDQLVGSVEQRHGIEILEFDEALKTLEALNPRQAEVVSRRFFAGLEVRMIAEQLGVSVSTVEKDWKIARAWLRRTLSPTDQD